MSGQGRLTTLKARLGALGALTAIAAAGVAGSATAAPSTGGATGPATAAASTGGTTASSTPSGWHWKTVGRYPGKAQIEALSCATASNCIAVGESYPPRTFNSGNNLALRTTDGGKRWTRLNVPHSPYPNHDSTLAEVACPTVRHCVSIGTAVDRRSSLVTAYVTNNDGTSWTSVPIRHGIGTGFQSLLPNGLACPTATVCYVSGTGKWGLLKSTDGGRRWARVTLPARVTSRKTIIGQISCPTASQCVAIVPGGSTTTFAPMTTSGRAASPRRPAPVASITTTDGGRHWKLVKFNVRGFAGPNAISCTTIGSCVAVGGDWTNSPGDQDGRFWPEAWRMTGDGTSWQRTVDNRHGAASWTEVACESHFCAAVAEAGGLVTSNDGGRHWSKPVFGTALINGLSCSPSFGCIALANGKQSNVVAAKP